MTRPADTAADDSYSVRLSGDTFVQDMSPQEAAEFMVSKWLDGSDSGASRPGYLLLSMSLHRKGIDWELPDVEVKITDRRTSERQRIVDTVQAEMDRTDESIEQPTAQDYLVDVVRQLMRTLGPGHWSSEELAELAGLGEGDQPTPWTVVDQQSGSVQVMARFATHDLASEYIGSLPGAADGRYGLDGPEVPVPMHTVYVVEQTGATAAFLDQDDAESYLIAEAWAGAQHLQIVTAVAPAHLEGDALAEWCASNAPTRSRECEDVPEQRRTRVAEDVGNPGKWVAQYYDPAMEIWFDIGDARATREEAQAHLDFELKNKEI